MSSTFSFFNYVAPPKWLVEKIDNPLHSMIVVGSMGCGKTTWTLSLIAKAVEKLLNDGVDGSEILVVRTQSLSMLQTLMLLNALGVNFTKVKYLYWFNDDAPSAVGQHGRRAMSAENVRESQFYTVIRHELERRGFRGFLFVAHATQVYHLIDITFRRTAKVKAFKDYPEEPSDLRLVGPMLGKTYLRKLREITKMVYSPRTFEEMIEGLSSAVVKFVNTKKVVTIERKEIPSSVAFVPTGGAWGHADRAQLVKSAFHQVAPHHAPLAPPIGRLEFRELVRKYGIQARNTNIDLLYENIMRRLGYIVEEKEEREATAAQVAAEGSP